MDISLNGIEIPYDLNWIDRYWVSVLTTDKSFALDGSVILTQRKKTSGRPITLQGSQTSGWTDKILIEQLIVLAEVPDNILTLIIYGDTYIVKFDNSDGDAIEVNEILDFSPDPADDWKYYITLRFITCS